MLVEYGLCADSDDSRERSRLGFELYVHRYGGVIAYLVREESSRSSL